MFDINKNLGAFIVPTGVGASIGGYAGDASVWAREFAKHFNLIVNPNVVNAGGFSGITDNMLYVEGYTLDSFFKGEINLQPASANKIGVVFDRAVPQEVLNIHINTLNAVKTVYGIDITDFKITETPVGVEFSIDKSNISTGKVKNIDTLLSASEKLIAKKVQAIALVCMFDDPENDDGAYADGKGVDPVGGVEAVISHYISKKLRIPCAHSPAFADFSICTRIVDPKASSEYITPTFLPCVLLGLNNAPLIVEQGGISVSDVEFLVMPYNSLGSIPVFEALKRGIKVLAVKENSTVLNVRNDNLHLSSNIMEFESYSDCLDFMLNNVKGIAQ